MLQLENSHWDIPVLRELLEEILPRRRNFENFAVEHDFPGIGPKKVLVDGRRIGSGRPGEGVMMLTTGEE